MNTALKSSPDVQTGDRRALLAERLRQAAEAPEAVPLSFAQQRLWFLDQLEPGKSVYNVPIVVQLTGSLKVSALQQALDGLVERHEILRTRFVGTEGNPVQIVDETARVELGLEDLRDRPESECGAEARARVQTEINRPFDLSSAPPVRATLLRLKRDEHWFILTLHHIVSDEWSLKICFRELTEFYKAACQGRAPVLPELPIQYADYAVWQRDWLRGELLKGQLEYWRRQLSGNPPVLELPADHTRPAVASFSGSTRSRSLSKELTERLRDLAERHDATLFMILLAAFKTLLHRYTQQEDIVIGSPIAGRTRLETEPLIGFFVNTVILRTDATADPPFEEFLARVREVTLDAYAHQDLPFEKVVEELHPQRTLSHMPFTRIMFSTQGALFDEWHWPDLTLRRVDVECETAKFDLTFIVQETAQGLSAQAEFNRELFEVDSIERLLRHFELLLEGIVAHPERRLSELPLLTESERRQLLVEWNDTRTDYPRGQCLHSLFEAQAARKPDEIAVVFGKDAATYGELNARANQLARRLAKLSVGPDVLVGICVERSVELVVAMLGILKAGGAYVPLDPAYPKERIAFMLADAYTPVLLTQERLLPRLPPRTATVICLDSDWEWIARENASNLPGFATEENLAYVIYTSGSTGRPKGVAVPHRAVNRLVLDTSYVQLTPGDRVAQVSNASFDAVTFEVWGALLNGARLVGISNDVALSPRDFARELREQQISTLFLTTALFNQLAGDAPGALGSVRTVLFGGEAVDPKWVRSVLEDQPPQRLLHVYGPTENTTFTTWHRVQDVARDATNVPIGRPISNTECYVLDPYLNPVPIGVPGELYVGGDGLARGYWNQPQLTAERFVRHPFSRRDAGELLYRTGDLVRWLPDGTIEFLGRLDRQVKIRGFRVELDEVQAVLSRHPAIGECIVTLHQDGADQKQLVAYFVARRRHPTASDLRRFLNDRLPEYMVPAAFVQLDALPLTPNGKINRQALPEPGKARPSLEKNYATPRDAVELKLTEIWEHVLGIQPIGIEDRFFDLGGHSLLAVRLIAQIEKVFQRKLRLATIFQAQTIEQLAGILREEIQESHGTANQSLVEIHSEGSWPPIYFVHGAGGGMFWGYVNLSRHLGADQPVFALKSRGLDEREEFGSIEEMAAQYVADLRAAQLHGPYYLGGYCFGGNVAFEMARQLRALGEEVALLALLNCAPPNSDYMRIQKTPLWAMRFAKNIFYWINYFRNWSPAQRREFIRWKREGLGRRWSRLLGHRNETPAQVDTGNLVDLSSYSPEQRKLWEAHIRALASYHPQPYPGRVHLFRSPGHPLVCSFAADYGWGALAPDVRISIVPGVHEKILEEPCVQVVADGLRKIIDETQKGRRTAAELQPSVPGDRTDAPPSPSDGAAAVSGPLEYWKRRLNGAPALLDLPADRPRPAKLNGTIAREPILFSAEFSEALEEFSRVEQGPLFVTLLAAFQVLLRRYTGATDLVVGSMAARRPGSNGAPKTRVPLRGDLSGDPTFHELLGRLRAVAQEANEYALPLETHLENLGLMPNASYAPLFQVMLVLDRDEPDSDAGKTTGLGDASLDLAIRLARTREGLSGWMEYSPELFDAGRIEGMISHFGTLLESAVADPAERISLLPLMPERQVNQVLIDWNATEKEFPAHLTLAQLFEAQVARTPDALALVAENERFTYRELNARANQLAHHLRSLGVGPETLVGICMERSWRLIVGILAVLKSGGAYVPLDPAYPKDRLAFILDDARAPVVLTQASLKAISAATGAKVICLDSDWDAIAANCEENPFSGAESANLGYVIYTSGSTGQPKGVALEHRSAVALICWAKDVFQPEELAGVLASTSICFDLSVFEMFVPLSWGGAVILASNALALPGLPARDEVTLINTVPSAIRELLRIKGVPPSVRVVNLAGEPLATALVNRIYEQTSARKVYDLYGPSETTTYSTFTLRQPEVPATIGRPLANEQVYLLDANREPVPPGVPGEIYIGGVGVGRGYLNRPELTQERFVANPFRPGTRLYRTGDLARWRPDGNLEFLGRTDHQVKIRGFRIELGEIESALRKHPDLREVVVLAREDQPGDKRLAAYVVARPGRAVAVDALRQALKQQLPEYMIPPAFVFLETLPLTPNGKIDRKALPVPQAERGQSNLVLPRTPAEEQLAAIWREVLSVREVGIDDNFFDLGGHSLLAIQVISRVRETFNVELPLSGLFDAPTIAKLAESLASGEWTQNPLPPLRHVFRDHDLPASSVQERLWFLDQLEPGGHAYNVPLALRLKGKLDAIALQRALDEIVRRHEALRTCFAAEGGTLNQIIAPFALSRIELMEVTRFPAGEREERAQTILNAEAQGPFNLADGPLLRVVLVRLDAEDHAFLVVMHHTISDGWSLTLFCRELETLYDAFTAGQPGPALPDLAIQYADFAHWKRQWMQGALLEQETGWWREKLAGAPPTTDLPTDRAESNQPGRAGANRSVVLAPEASAALMALGRREGATPFVVLMTALTAALRKWTRQRDFVIGTVVAGRNRRETENVIGCFMNFLPIRTRMAGDETGLQLLTQVKNAVLEAQAHQDCPFEKIVEAINPERRLNRNPLYNVALLFQNFPTEFFRSESLQVNVMPVQMDAALLDLRFEAEHTSDGLLLRCEYRVDLFDPQTIDALLASCRQVLETLVQNPSAKVADLEITAALKAQRESARRRAEERTLAISATFTAEPVEESLRYWMKELDVPAKIQFAPYHQVFQQLLDPGSVLGANARGVNVLLVRLEDWAAPGVSPGGNNADISESAATDLERKVREFVAALQTAARRGGTPHLVFVCPPSSAVASDPDRKAMVDRLEQFLTADLEKIGGVYLITSRELLDLYAVADYYDAGADELGRVPYTPVFFTALGTMIARRVHALLRPAPKLIVLDCDQTLWAGVCGEDGPKGITLDAPRRALQEFMRAQHEAGRLLAVCSKNNEEDVQEVFAHRLDFPLRPEHFAAWRLNWQPKSENLRSLAEELNLGLDSFVFLDDNPVECAEVEANCPEVLTLTLPENPEAIPQFLKHCWALDTLKLTAEDRRRGEMYRENREREQWRERSVSLADFIAGLELEIRIAPMTPEQLQRVSQLTLRTNQFNFTTRRRTEAEIQKLAGEFRILAVTVKDRFGDYGLVGAVMYQLRGDALDVDTFLLSCRILGRGVEHRILAELGRIALEQNARWLDVHFQPSAKNQPAADFLRRVGEPFRQPLNGGFLYRIPADVAARSVFPPALEESQSLNPPAPRPLGVAPRAGKFTRCQAIALQANAADRIHEMIEASATARSAKSGGYVPPRTDLERRLCAIWEKLLRVERVGARDNFFDLGGHSLLAVRLFGEIEKITGRKFPLVTLFQAPTIEQLAGALDLKENVSRSPIFTIQANGSRPPLFLVHGAGGDVLWGYANLVKHLHPEQPVYGIKSRGQVGLEEYEHIEKMARYYLDEVKRLQPSGPYYLGGYCFGGNVVYEMARQLHEQGEAAALIALLDTAPANAGYERVTWWRPAFAWRFLRNLSCWFDDFRQLPREEMRRFITRKLRVMRRKFVGRFLRRDRSAAVDLEEVIDPVHFPEHELKLWEVHIRAIVEHVERPYRGAVTLFRTRGQPLLCSFEEDFCWGKLAKGGVTIKHIPGSHENVFMEPNVKFLAVALEESLAEARAKNPATARPAGNP